MRYRLATPASLHRQRGSIVISAAAGLLIGVILLGGVQLGYLFYVKRNVQKAVDMAALTGGQNLHIGADEISCDNATASALVSANKSMSSLTGANTQAKCGHWDPVQNSGERHFVAGAPTEAVHSNAIDVTATLPVPSFFPFIAPQPVSAESIAARPGDPVAIFSIGTSLVGVNSGSLTDLLSAAGLTISGSLVGYDTGLAGVDITPAGLLKKLGITVQDNTTVGGLNNLLATNTVALNDLLDAIVTVGGQPGLAQTDITLVNQLKTTLNVADLNVALGSAQSGRSNSLFTQIGGLSLTSDATTVLNTNINALQLISTAISVASAGHAVGAATAITLPGLIGPAINITSQLGVIEPAQIGIGGVGATAHTAQLRLFIKLKSDTTKQSLLSSLLSSLISLNVDFSIGVEAVTATATITKLCDQKDQAGRDLANVSVDAPLAQLCIGGYTAANVFSSTQSCNTNDLASPMISLTVAGAPLLAIKTPISIPALSNSGHDNGDWYEGNSQQIPDTSNPLAIGTTLKTALSQLLGSAFSNASTLTLAQATQYATSLWGQTSGLCSTADAGIFGGGCRNTRLQSALSSVKASSSGLGTYAGGNSDPTLLDAVGQLTTSVVNGVTGLLNSLLGGLLDSCTGLGGSSSSCITELATNLRSTVNAGGKSSTNGLVGLTGVTLSALQPVLDGLGSTLSSLLNTMGLQIGPTDVKLISLQCHGTSLQLVY